MVKLRVVLQYNNKSPTPGFIIADTIEFADRADALTFVERCNANPALPWQIIDYSFPHKVLRTGKEILRGQLH